MTAAGISAGLPDVSTKSADVADTRLWCMHVSGMDEVHPAPDRATAQRWAAQNAVAHLRDMPNPTPFHPVMNFTVQEWPHSAASHAAGLADSIIGNTWPIDPLGGDAFEAIIHDVHLPSMTARFRIPEGLPFSEGLYTMRWARIPTAIDRARWDHLPEPPEDDDTEGGDTDLVRGALSQIDRTPTSKRQRTRRLWSAVMDLFGQGSTRSREICKRFGLDPEKQVRW